LRRQVEDQLALDPRLEAAGIGVAVHQGIVTLTGHVGSAAQVRVASDAALRVKGVRGLANELDVVLPGDHVRDDEEIALASANVLSWSTQVPPGSVKVRVVHGAVTLEGEVRWHYQRAAAERLIRELIGVRQVVNRIEVKSEGQSESLKAKVEAALRQCGISGSARIRVETRADHVTLWGTVDSWAERDEAERAAWCVRGVCHVDNHLSPVAPAVTTIR
ncbi:MAG: BON domain-containing protein, partial [Bryobacteraceae bacterium]|nr:BON domain-containing protein [Bryobacteraceae bacterium]